ncbi:MAG: hypothetical protein P4L79_05895 [Legionella sp.]|uniref:hypothetical protein n=1 Tax=Legionella sp. TaxID=459 RepID=UPI002847ADEC|nr:hypothetical protein [Legionella sp.]
MRNFLFLFLSQHRAFWWMRSFGYKVFVRIGAQVFRYQFNARDKKDNLVSFRHLLQITQTQLILALLFAILLQLVDPVVIGFYKLTFLKIPDDSDYVTFLVSISGIGGVFIGLYYAAISTIAGSIYAKVPNNIRDLLAQERIGNMYMHFLSFITFLGISLASFRVLGFSRICLAIPVMLVAAGVGIIAFVKLGQRVFYLFDPTALSLHLFGQLRQFVKMVNAGGYRWNDAVFQRHANKLASSSLDTLETLSDITKNEAHLHGSPFISLSENLISFMLFYERTKKYIPSDSQWYEQKYVHRDWYRTEDTRVSVAHQTGTILQPDVTNDKEWVEVRVLPIIIECLKVNLNEERYNETLELAGYVDAYLKLLARSGRTDRALNILEKLGDSVFEVVSPVSKNEIIANEILEKLAIIEKFASMPITIALACREHIEEIDAEKVEKRLSNITWCNDSNLYKHGFPSYCLPRLEWFKPRLNFEVLAEGQEITPIWYQKELLLQIEADTFVENTKSLVTKGSDLYCKWINKTTSAKHPWLVGAVMSREWEFWHKVDHQIEIWPRKWSALSDDKKIEGLPWSCFKYEKLKEASQNRQSKLLKLMSAHNLRLELPKRPEGFPDYAGQFLHTSGEVSFEALSKNDQNLLGNVFTMYLYGCIMRFDNLSPKTSSMDWRAQQDFKIAAAPLLDLMELSGYARLMADYHGNEQLWQIVTDAWDHFFAEKGEQSPLSLLAASIAFTEGAFEIPHRGVLRTNWSMRIRRKLSNVPRHEVFSRRYLGSHTKIDHNSPLIRIFAREPHGSFHDGIDIFITFYLRTKDGANQLNFGRKGWDLQDSLEREESKKAKEKGEEIVE